MSDNFNVNMPLELPPDEYNRDYIIQIINQFCVMSLKKSLTYILLWSKI